MGLLSKLGIGANIAGNRSVGSNVFSSHVARGTVTASMPVVTSSKPASDSQGTERLSNGLKEFLWNLEGLGRGTLLDMGPAWQTTLNFFIERGFRVTSDDFLRAWKDFLSEEAALREAEKMEASVDLTPSGRALRFLEGNLRYTPNSFDAVLMWDMLDYLEPVLARHTVDCVTELLRPGGVVFAMFHSKKPQAFQRYRVLDSNMLQVISAPALCPAQTSYQNRQIQELFGRFRTMKSFIGRDQLREAMFVK